MKTQGLMMVFLLVLTSCVTPDQSDLIIIEGNLRELPDGKVYLANAFTVPTPIDTTESKDGHFIFKIKSDSSFVPYMVSLFYPDSTSPTKFKLLIYANEFLTPTDTTKFYHYGTSGFYLERGKTIIKDRDRVKPKDSNQSLQVAIENPGKETEIMYRNQFTDFGFLGNADISKRQARIALFKKQITQYPFSYFLLDGIYTNKEQFSEPELKELIALFNDQVQQSVLGRKVNNYLANRVDTDQPYPNLKLETADKNSGWIMNNAAKVNMLVFWASWCGPCRKEIPQLKELYTKFQGQGVNMVSISIDENQANWQKALAQEKMNWQQFIVEKQQIELIQQKFNFSAIPLVILTDSRGKELKRFIGNEDANTKLIYEVIMNHLVNIPE